MKNSEDLPKIIASQNQCVEIQLGVEQSKPHRFNSIGDYNIPLDEEKESYELTRIVLFEKTITEKKFGEQWHKLFEKLSLEFNRPQINDVVLSIKTVPVTTVKNIQIKIQKIKPSFNE
jgi:hypothetical protein